MKNYLKSFFAVLAVAFCFVNYAFAKTNIQADAPTAVNTSQTEFLLTATAQVGAVILADDSDRLIGNIGCNTPAENYNSPIERFASFKSSLDSNHDAEHLTRNDGVLKRLFVKRE